VVECPESVDEIDKLGWDSVFPKELLTDISMLVLQEVIRQTVPVVSLEVAVEINVGPQVALLSVVLGGVQHAD
jgi:hypothetical protein